MLIQEGVTPLLSPESFFDMYPELSKVQEQEIEEKPKKAPADDVRIVGSEKTVYDALFDRDMTTDELIEKTGLSATECNTACFMLELKRMIARLPGNLYHREE